MGSYDIQQVCLNGHQITDMYRKYPENKKNHCTICGAETLIKCPTCDKEIPGRYMISATVSSNTIAVIPSYCNNCGVEYPWTNSANKLRQAIIVNSLNKAMQEFQSKENKSQEAILHIEQICSRFHLVVKQLRERHNSRTTLDIEDEYDVQDLFHALLKLFFDDIRAEEWTPSYAGKSARVDFLLKSEQVIIEIKKTGKSLGVKELGDQLIVDIGRYKVHPDCKTLICFVYDPEGKITNPQGIEKDLSHGFEGFPVKVFIIPKGY